jgi:uncharacterized protein (TIGR02594 family)
MVSISAFSLAQRFIGLKEAAGMASNPQILAMLRLDESWPAGDETAWCSAFVNYVAWLLRLPRSKSLAARSWLQVGIPIPLGQASADSDVVVIQRGDGKQPGPEVVNAPGHVGFFQWTPKAKPLKPLQPTFARKRNPETNGRAARGRHFSICFT